MFDMAAGVLPPIFMFAEVFVKSRLFAVAGVICKFSEPGYPVNINVVVTEVPAATVVAELTVNLPT
jgi:hypothetical protein